MEQSPIVKAYSHEYQTEVVDLVLHIQQEEYNIPLTAEDQPDLLDIENFYQTGNGNFWVVLYDNNVIGTISLLDIDNNQVALRKLFVDKEFRGSKYKTAWRLLEEAKKWTKDRSINEIFLGTAPQFKAGHKFYEKNGFLKINRDDLPETFPVFKIDTIFYKYFVK